MIHHRCVLFLRLKFHMLGWLLRGEEEDDHLKQSANSQQGLKEEISTGQRTDMSN